MQSSIEVAEWSRGHEFRASWLRLLTVGLRQTNDPFQVSGKNAAANERLVLRLSQSLKYGAAAWAKCVLVPARSPRA